MMRQGGSVTPSVATVRFDSDRVIAHAVGDTDDFADGVAALIERLAPLTGDLNALLAAIPVAFGHFAIALQDRESGAVYLIADPLGSRPLYYRSGRDDVAWSFSLKDLRGQIAPGRPDVRALDEVFLYNWLADDHTLLEGVRRVPPSHVVCLRPGEPPLQRRYARLDFAPAVDPRPLEHWVDAADAAFDAYFARLRRRHDRIAVFFSGGVDSSLLLGKARQFGFDRLLAVTAYFPNHANPEADLARRVARHLGVEHRMVEVSDAFVGAFLPDLLWRLEMPRPYLNGFARAAILASVAGEVGCVVTGEGAGSMFSREVERLAHVARVESRRAALRWLPRPLRVAMAGAAGRIRPGAAELLRDHATDIVRRQGEVADGGGVAPGDLVPELRAIRARRKPYFYGLYEPAAPASPTVFWQNRRLYTMNRNQFLHYALLADAHAIAVASPFLSTDVARLALTLPDAVKWEKRGDKPILRRLACRHIPEADVYAPKMGFEIPFADWIRGPLAPWCGILTDPRTRARGLFDPAAVARLDPARDGGLLWTAVALEMFLRRFLDGDPPPVAAAA